VTLLSANYVLQCNLLNIALVTK